MPKYIDATDSSARTLEIYIMNCRHLQKTVMKMKNLVIQVIVQLNNLSLNTFIFRFMFITTS